MSNQAIALVTGTSSGIGLSTAVALAKAGYQVVATMRNLDKRNHLEELARQENVEVDLQHLDVQDQHSVQTTIDYVIKKYGKIDLLVNNAGAGFVGTTEQTSIDEVRQVMDVNFISVWRMTQAVLPLMRTAGRGHIISVSSIGGLVGQPFNDAYCAAKFAVEGMMESLAPVVSGMGIRISVIEPGPVNTKFVENVGGVGNAEESADEADAYAEALSSYLQAVRGRFATGGQTPDDIASVIVEAARAEQPHFRYQTSDFIKNVVASKFVDPSGDQQLQMSVQSLWKK